MAGWRETLLAQKVLRGLTKGYRNHPQLERFKSLADPVASVAVYLHGLADEADIRGYRFDRSRIVDVADARMSVARSAEFPVTSGQLEYELSHLRSKVVVRAPQWLPCLDAVVGVPPAHSAFVVISGDIEPWEII
ncbi:pyrimidine dimer DNA glycosylase/endonuclease V [Dermatophilus congolensis]|uniref:pyrimidine dimer DNA glycosylase/endonuclease V n=1 Tax=Dermatophilus congolensis TaxID=1863 RepID=UPI00312C948E